MKIIAITNQKGGAGKTTTTHALMAGLAKQGYKVLAVDLDPQRNLSFTLQTDTAKPTALGILTGEAKTKDAIQQTAIGDFISSTKQLAGADSTITETGKEYRLKEALESVSENYDFILIDTPPALNILTINALTACNSVVIPAQADIYSIQGIEGLAETVQPIKKYCNNSIQIDGILLTRYSDRNTLSRNVKDIAGQIAEKLGTRLFNTTIREAVAIKEAQINLQSIFDYAPTANVTADYTAFINELLEGWK